MIDKVRAFEFIVPRRSLWNSKSLINRRRKILRALWIEGRISADVVCSTNDATTLNSTAGKKYRLCRTPVVTARLFVVTWQ